MFAGPKPGTINFVVAMGLTGLAMGAYYMGMGSLFELLDVTKKVNSAVDRFIRDEA